MSDTGSVDTGLGSNLTAVDTGEGGGGSGTISQITSTDGSVVITNPTGPVTNLHVSAASPGSGIPGPTALGSPGVAASFRRSDQTAPAFRSDLPLSTTWFIDPVNGSDASTNPGTSSATALKTRSELYRRWWNAEITSNTTVTVLGTIPTSDNLIPQCLIAQGITVTFQGSLGPTTGFGGAPINNTLFTGTVSNFVTASATPAADDSELNDTTIPVSFTATGALADGVILRQTTPATLYAYVIKDLGTKTARVTTPINNSATPLNTGLSVGNAYTLYTMWGCPLDNWGVFANQVLYDTFLDNSTTINVQGGGGWGIGFGVRRRRVFIPVNGRIGVTMGTQNVNCLFTSTGASGLILYQLAMIGAQMTGGGFKGVGTSAFTVAGFLAVSGIVSQGAQLGTIDRGALQFEGGSSAFHDCTAACLLSTANAPINFVSPTAGVGISGKGNTGKLIQISVGGALYYGAGVKTPPFVAASTTDANPILVGAQTFTVAAVPAVADTLITPQTIFPTPLGGASNPAPAAAVVAINNAPAGSPAAPVRYLKIPDGAGGFYTFPSLT